MSELGFRKEWVMVEMGATIAESEEENGGPWWKDRAGVLTSYAFSTIRMLYSPGMRKIQICSICSHRRGLFSVK